MSPPPQKSKEEVVQEFRIQSIQDAAMRVIARKGMSAATMQEIADEAGVAKGTIYLYFRDRDELVEKTFESAITQLKARIDQAMATDAPIQQKLRDIFAAKLTFFTENREFFRLYIALRHPEGNAQQQRRHKRMCEPQYRASIDRFAQFLESAMERGEIRKMDSQRLALFIIEGTNAIVIDRVMAEAPPPEAADLDFMAELILSGIRAAEP
ncbi:MAG TPA: helix-turn-helix domain-containing protein [Thermoanaerobaculia bacterium]|nr:helix-turn-helix domain-containing protein [Thermoanaerobaculia bacterium]